jgi:Xaa-Pro dipeptidase
MKTQKLMERMVESDLDSIMLIEPANVAYIAGFKPTSFSILIWKDDPLLLVPKLDLEVSRELSKIPVEELKPLKEVKKMLSGKIGVERSMPVGTFQKLVEDSEIKLTNLVELARMVKSKNEIKNIQNAINIAENALNDLEFVGTETEVAAKIEYNMKVMGSTKPSFDTMVASGVRSSFPHATCTEEPLESPLLMDWGATYENYASDTSRTIVHSEKEEELLEIVIEAQKEAIKNIKPGVKASYIDKVARRVITEYGYGENFVHSTGHGVGLEIHEEPSLSIRDNTQLQKSMVVTVEPGIYLKGEFGVRIEDMVLVKRKARILNKIKSRLFI